MAIDDRSFGEKLRKARQDRDLTQKGLAETSGITQGNISRIEAGTISPSLTTIQALERGLGDPRIDLLADPESDLALQQTEESLQKFLQSQLAQALALTEEEIADLRRSKWFVPKNEMPGDGEWYEFVRLKRSMRRKAASA